MQVKALVNFSYPASLAIRNQIRSGEHLPSEKRGEIVDVVVGDVIEAPDDLLDGWLANGYVEAVQP